MTLSSRHRIRNSSPGGLRPSTLPLGHGGSPQYWLSHVDGEETFFVSFKPPIPGTEPRALAWKAAVLTTTLGPPPTAADAIITRRNINIHYYLCYRKIVLRGSWAERSSSPSTRPCSLTVKQARSTNTSSARLTKTEAGELISKSFYKWV